MTRTRIRLVAAMSIAFGSAGGGCSTSRSVATDEVHRAIDASRPMPDGKQWLTENLSITTSVVLQLWPRSDISQSPPRRQEVHGRVGAVRQGLTYTAFITAARILTLRLRKDVVSCAAGHESGCETYVHCLACSVLRFRGNLRVRQRPAADGRRAASCAWRASRDCAHRVHHPQL